MASKKLDAAMREVHSDEPSTVTRAKHFGSGGKEAMLRAIAFSKARKAGAKIPKKKGKATMKHGGVVKNPYKSMKGGC